MLVPYFFKSVCVRVLIVYSVLCFDALTLKFDLYRMTTSRIYLVVFLPCVLSQLSKPIADDTVLEPNKFRAMTPLKAEQLIL